MRRTMHTSVTGTVTTTLVIFNIWMLRQAYTVQEGLFRWLYLTVPLTVFIIIMLRKK